MSASSEGAGHAHPEIVNWIQLLAKSTAPSKFSEFLIDREKVIFSLMVITTISVFTILVSRRAKLIPGRVQLGFETLLSGLDGLVCGILGSQGRTYTPFIGSLFIYILFSNLFGLIPLQNSTMAFITTTAPLAVCVFFYVQWIGITRSGLKGYLFHLCGSPNGLLGLALVPIMLPLHIIGEFAKPLSLSLRLFGNIMGEHILVAVFLMLGVSMLSFLPVPAGFPLHFPFLFLSLLLGTIQAFVFTLLTTVYIAMMLPHHEEAHA
jgi:F-type H+-transporting ATPase subunit a